MLVLTQQRWQGEQMQLGSERRKAAARAAAEAHAAIKLVLIRDGY